MITPSTTIGPPTKAVEPSIGLLAQEITLHAIKEETQICHSFKLLLLSADKCGLWREVAGSSLCVESQSTIRTKTA